MGSGYWNRANFESYQKTMGRTVDASGSIKGDFKAQEIFTSKYLNPALDPMNVVRECCDSDEHPNTVPVIMALDVTGSMGAAAVEVAKKLNIIITDLYQKVDDLEIMAMGIGDLVYDRCPIQMTQFESDIRIAEQIDKIFFEFGGGGNMFESYTAAWYMALNHTKIDAEKRGVKPIIITMGDERLNPYLPAGNLGKVTGDRLQADIETDYLFEEAKKRFDIFHINVLHRGEYDLENIEKSFKKYLDEEHFMSANLDEISGVITNIVISSVKQKEMEDLGKVVGGISW